MTKNEFPMENLNWAIFKKHVRNIVGWKYENIKKQAQLKISCSL